MGGVCAWLSAFALAVGPLPVKLFTLLTLAMGMTLLFGGLLGALYKVLIDARAADET